MVKPGWIFLAAMGALLASAQPKKLSIEQIAFHQFEDGPVLPPTYEFVPGETVYFSCRIAGYHIEQKDESRMVNLSWQMLATDSKGGVLLEKEKSGSIKERLLPEDKSWIPKFLVTLVIPSFAPTGAYRVAVLISDQYAGTEISGELKFHVHGHDIEQSDSLVARNFQFLHNENDELGTREPVYHPGERMFARFDLTGYKLGPNNALDVSYGLAILNAVGTQMFDQPVAASETDHSFYPRRFVGGILSLSLDPNLAKGAYILVIKADDKIGMQHWEAQHSFQVQ